MKEKNFDHIVTIILLAICVVLATVTIRNNLSNKTDAGKSGLTAQQNKNETATNVSVTKVAEGDFIKYTTIGADIIDESDETDLKSEYAGKVTKIYVKENDEIHKGDIICTLDNSTPGNQYKATDIKSVIDGKVEDVPIYVGETLSETSTTITVQPTPDLRVSAQLPEKYLSILKQGMEATFTTQAWPDDPIEATLTEIGDEVNTTNRTVTIKLKPKDSSKLLAGMFVSLKLITEEVDNCLTVPNDAISSYLDKNVVYIVKDNVATRQTVTTGSSNATVTVITEGLQAGDEVVTAGSVTDQTKVNIVK